MPRKTKPFEERFWSKVEKTDGCWVWTAFRDDGPRRGPSGIGRGRIGRDGKHYMAHRESWRIHFGEIPDGMHVLHRCDNPSCVCPDHLFLGTNDDNMADKVAKGRQMRGSGHYKAYLSESDVVDIRSLRVMGACGAELARQFGISQAHIWSITERRIWKCVP